MSSIGAGLVIPALWQQEAVRALQQGKDVVVQAPTGSGKTYIFELLYPNLKTQAVFTVLARALANDKLSEWLHPNRIAAALFRNQSLGASYRLNEHRILVALSDLYRCG
jgi:replicative superfamily II helicase